MKHIKRISALVLALLVVLACLLASAAFSARFQIGVVIADFAEAVSESGSVEKKPKLEGRQMIMFIAPLKK